MRIALSASTPVGARVGRILQAERDLEALGLWRFEAALKAGRRTIRTDSPAGYDVAVIEELSEEAFAEAVDARIPIVTPQRVEDASLARRAAAAGTFIAHRCDLAGGIAEVLAAHESSRSGSARSTMVAWTFEGRPLSSGEAIPFPGPVGAKWGRPVTDRSDAYEAPVVGRWGAAMARVESGGAERILGAADLAEHLAAIALAAAAVTVARGVEGLGLVEPPQFAEEHLAAALKMGLEVAAYSAAV